VKPERGKVVVVPNLPLCDFCKEPPAHGPYDFKTRMGPWAHGCELHWTVYAMHPGVLGVGIAQLWITQDQVTD